MKKAEEEKKDAEATEKHLQATYKAWQGKQKERAQEAAVGMCFC